MEEQNELNLKRKTFLEKELKNIKNEHENLTQSMQEMRSEYSQKIEML